jgi:predicted RNA-binding protein with TRAM domain
MYRERRSGGYGGESSGGGGSFGGGGDFGFRPRPAPVRVGEEIEVTIEAVGAKGDGIAKKNGFVLFVPGVKEGQRVKIRVTKVLQKVGFAEVAGPAPEGASAPKQEYQKQEEAEAPAPEPSAEDSEDFGEEGEDKDADEE